MSRFTTEVRFICETYAGETESKGYSDVNDIVEAAESQIFEQYPIFDEAYRKPLNMKILRHYYTREICAETVGLWKLWLNNKMNEIMPYYNKLYESELLKFNPLYDVDLTTVRARDEKRGEEASNVTSGSESRSNSNSRQSNSVNSDDSIVKNLDTPQGGLGGLVNDNYMTNGQVNNSNTAYTGNERGNASSSGKSSGVSSGTRDVKSTEDYLEKVSGKNGGENYSKKLEDFRKTFLNIDVKVINDLKDCFFGLWE